MPTSPDFPKFQADSSGKTIGTLDFQSVPSDAVYVRADKTTYDTTPQDAYIIQEQPGRDRVVVWGPEMYGFKPVSIKFKGEKSSKADLRDLELERSGKTRDQIKTALLKEDVEFDMSDPYPHR